jgi:cell division control protein 45
MIISDNHHTIPHHTTPHHTTPNQTQIRSNHFLFVAEFQSMILENEHWHFGYEQILKDCRSGEDGAGSALLLCNADVDAMASARILSFMLRSDGIHYQLSPCTNYTSLEKSLIDTQLTDVKAVVLLNFGAARNLTKLFDSGVLSAELKIYVMDSRKPVHLGNIYAGENIVIFMDKVQGDELPSDGDNLSGDDSSSSEEEDSDDSDSDSGDSDIDDEEEDDEEEASFDDVIGEQTKPTHITASDQDPAYDGEAEDENDDDETRRRPREEEDGEESSQSSNKRQRNEDTDGNTDVEQSDGDSPEKSQTEASNPRDLHRQRRDRLRTYYSTGSFYGTPAAYIAYELAMQLRFGDQSDLLWLACVGVTDAYLHARLDLSGYSALTLELKRFCLRLFPNDMFERVSNTIYAEDLLGGSSEDRTKITFSDNGSILAEKDYRFFLLRHSSLYESMVYSDYIATKLQVWTKPGLQKLQELLAKMGYPLEECKQPFAFMKPSLRRRLQEKLEENSEVRQD